MSGLSAYSATKRSLVGIDWLNLASGAMKGFGGDGSSAGNATAAAQKAAADAATAKQKAEDSAKTWKMVGLAGLVVIVGGVVLLRKKAKK